MPHAGTALLQAPGDGATLRLQPYMHIDVLRMDLELQDAVFALRTGKAGNERLRLALPTRSILCDAILRCQTEYHRELSIRSGSLKTSYRRP